MVLGWGWLGIVEVFGCLGVSLWRCAAVCWVWSSFSGGVSGVLLLGWCFGGFCF